MNQLSILLITSKQPNNKRHGTGFVIKSDAGSLYTITCAHVIEDLGGKNEILVNGLAGELIASGTSTGIDLAVIKTNLIEGASPLRLIQSRRVSSISISGFISVGSHYLLDTLKGEVNQLIHLSSKEGIERIEAFEVLIDEGNLEPGHSGAPVLDDEGNVIAIMSHRWAEGKKGIAINIAALSILWQPINEALLTRVSEKVKVDWGDSVASRAFYGRNEILKRLEQWVLESGYQMVAVLGIGGIGKSSLTLEFTKEVKDHFDYVIWRDLRNGLPLDVFLGDCIKFISDQTIIDLPDQTSDKINFLMQLLSHKRCLIVLDNAESLLVAGKAGTHYRPGFETYSEFLRKAGNLHHKSCIFITSREKLHEIKQLESATGPIRSVTLGGLEDSAALELLDEWTLTGDFDAWMRLISHYRGNPLALKIAASAIQRWFNGDISLFLAEEVSLLGDIEAIIRLQIDTLTETEKEIFYWLALYRESLSLPKLFKDIAYWFVISRESISADHLKSQILRSISSRELLDALDSLLSKSLIEKNNERFSLQPVVMEFLNEEFIDSIFIEFVQEKPNLLRSHAIIQAHAKDYILASQKYFILSPLVNKLIKTFGQVETKKKVKRLLNQLRESTKYSIGYAGGNLINLLIEMETDLSGYDFSNINIWQAHLANTPLRNVSLENSDISLSVFASTFDAMLCVAYSPSGRYIVAGAINGEAIVWDTESNKQIHRLQGHNGWIRSAAFSHDGKILATGSGDHTIRLWDISTGNCTKVLKEHTDWVRSVAFRPNNMSLVSAGSDGRIIEWDINTGKPIKFFEGHSDWIWSLACFQDGIRLVSGSKDRNVIIWDLSSGTEISRLQPHPQSIRTIDVSSDLELIATGCNDFVVRIWEAGSGKLLRELTGHTNRIWSVAFSPDGKMLATGSIDKTVRLWDTLSGEPLKTMQAHEGRVYSVAFHPQGNTLASASEDQTVRIWDTSTGWCLRSIFGHTSRVHDVSFHPSNPNLLLSGGSDRILRIWDIEDPQRPKEFLGHTGIIKSVAWADNETFATCGNDQTIRIWNIRNKSEERILVGHTSWVTTIDYSSSGRYLISGSDDRTVRLWENDTGNIIKVYQGHSSWVSSVVFSLDEQYIFSGSADTTVRKWNVQNESDSKILYKHTLRVNSVAINVENNIVGSASDDGTIMLWDLNKNEPLGSLTGHEGPVLSVAFSPNESLLASGGLDGTVRLWNINTRSCYKVLSGHIAGVWSVDFQNGSRLIASGSDDETIKLWDIEKGIEKTTFRSKKIYDGLNITGVSGLTVVEKRSLVSLGAHDSSESAG